MITTLNGQNFADTCGRVKSVLRQNLDEHAPVSPIPPDEIYSKCLYVIQELEKREKLLFKERSV
jgi:hypothetical protein